MREADSPPFDYQAGINGIISYALGYTHITTLSGFPGDIRDFGFVTQWLADDAMFNANSGQQAIDTIGVARDMGLTGGTASMVADTRAQWCDQALAFGDQVLSVINDG